MLKHAYLIMAHNEFDILEKLVTRLDYPNNDIFIHVDRKAKEFDCNHERKIIQLVKKGKIRFTKRLNVTWGGDSQIKLELMLLEEASQKYHDYYHLLSGVDLPIKSHDYIDAFFQQNQGKQFIFFDEEEDRHKYFLKRLRYYHIPINTANVITMEISSLVSKILYKLQYSFHTDRLKNCQIPIDNFHKGSCWFDITHDFARYALDQMNQKDYKRIFRFTNCCDEVFMQTIIVQSSFSSTMCNDLIRFADWSKGGKSPEMLSMSHWDALVKSSALFARKFSEVYDNNIVEKVYHQWV